MVLSVEVGIHRSELGLKIFHFDFAAFVAAAVAADESPADFEISSAIVDRNPQIKESRIFFFFNLQLNSEFVTKTKTRGFAAMSRRKGYLYMLSV